MRLRGWSFVYAFTVLLAICLGISIYPANSNVATESQKTSSSPGAPDKAPVDPGVQVGDEAKSQAGETYGRLPLYFIENRGQTDDAVKFMEKGRGHATFFTRDGVVLALRKSGKEGKDTSSTVLELSPI